MHVTPQLSSLSLSCIRPELISLFSQTGYSFGYGFVDYNSEADTEEAIDKLNGYYVRNKRLKVRRREGP